ncbi:PREDICTED: endothelial differentiation-related factor 1, partial [Myotis brandtii]|uniref:endothelial differentiation-related factor 1 n=1 Tax=Myotis brandtii TaxID=109478 RepID=UPI0007041AF2
THPETPFPRVGATHTHLSLSLSLSLFLGSHHPGAAGQNKQHSITKNTAKLDRETEELHHDRVTLEVGKVIQQGRQSKGLTQKDLATVSGGPSSRLWSGGWGCRPRSLSLPPAPCLLAVGKGVSAHGQWVPTLSSEVPEAGGAGGAVVSVSDAPSGLKLRGKDIGKPIEKGPRAK